jgi:hypothetical protein
MCPGPIVVLDVLQQDLAKMPFADHDDVVQAFTSNRANTRSAYAFCHGEQGAMTASRMFNIRD